jgi:hypothetical protein
VRVVSGTGLFELQETTMPMNAELHDQIRAIEDGISRMPIDRCSVNGFEFDTVMKYQTRAICVFARVLLATSPSLDSGSADRKLDQILARLDALGRQEITLMASVADIKAQADKALVAIAAESDKDDSIIALVTANTAQITALKQQLADAIANGADPAALQAVLDSLTAAETSALANAQKVTDAVNANTPAAPPPV